MSLLRDKLGPGMTPAAALRDARHGSTRNVRIAAIEALGALDSDEPARGEGASLLCELLADADPWVRQAAALGCADLGHGAANKALVAIAQSDPEPAARQGAVIALGRLGGPGSVDVVAAALDDREADVRFQAVGALAELAEGGDSAREVAAKLLPLRLEDDDAEVRGSAAAALGDLGVAEACDALAGLLDDSEPATRLEAAAALRQLGDGRDAAVAVLAEMLDADSIGVLAARTLYRFPDASAHAALARAATKRFGDPVVGVYAAATLLRLELDETAARARLQKGIASRKAHVAALSIELLGELASPWAVETLRGFSETRAGRRWADEVSAALDPADP